jgi:hypothetical protein
VVALGQFKRGKSTLLNALIWLVGVADRRPACDVGRDGDPRSDDEVNVPERGSVPRFSDVLATVIQKTEAFPPAS